MGRALNVFFSFSASSSRRRRSSRCALTLAEIASPGSEKVDLVGGFVDFAGTKAGLLVERLSLGIRFLVTFGWVGAGELEKDKAGAAARFEDGRVLRPSTIGFLANLATAGGFVIGAGLVATGLTVLGRAGLAAEVAFGVGLPLAGERR
jgi:hypothetical protein